MIVSASRRTDIPAYYADWMCNRIKEGYAYVRNPMNVRQVSKIEFDPEIVDCVVFWSKNPAPMLDKLLSLNAYTYYFQFTLNPYEQDVETNLPLKYKIIETFKKLSDAIGPEKVIWRYDPVLLSEKYTVQYHIEKFGALARELKGYTEKVIFSFVDFYKKISAHIEPLDIRPATPDEKNTAAENFSKAAKENNLAIETCAEDIDLSKYQIAHARCVDDRLIAKLTGRSFPVKKDRNQRRACGCVTSVDIGAYNSCLNGCLYCYANHGRDAARQNMETHDTLSPLLIGDLDARDNVAEKNLAGGKALQNKTLQKEFF